MALWHDYEWLVVCGSIVAFFMAWSIGANDVANSFATAVGSKSITIAQAVVIATFCEFLGAMLLGGQVVKTIAGGIADLNAFVEDPEFLAYGMMCALIGSSIWVTVATAYDLAVSTTHATVGGIMGFALVYKGSDAILWYQKATVVHTAAEYQAAKAHSNFIVASDQVPIRGLVPIIISWFTSPVCCCFIAAVHFFLVRTFVMRRKNALLYSFWALPIVVMYCIFLNTFFVVYKGGKTGVCTKGRDGAAESSKYSTKLCYKDISGSPAVKSSAAAWIAAAVAGGCTALVTAFVVPYVVRNARLLDEEGNKTKAAEIVAEGKAETADSSDLSTATKTSPDEETPNQEVVTKTWYHKMYDTATYGCRYDIHEAVATDATVVAMHANLERFDPRAEASFRPVQVFTSMCVSFAHGANDVANAVGPLAAINQVYRTRSAASSADLPSWILAIGACGIVVGLATYGYNIMRVLGTEMVILTPSRGFCCELATALVVSVGSMYGFPLSTTHSQTGSAIGIGLMENGIRGVNWRLFGKQIIGWIFTIIVAGFISAAVFAQAVYAPSVIMGRDVYRYEQMSMNITTSLIAKGMGPTYDLLKKDVPAGAPAITGATWTSAFETSYLKAARDTVSTSKKFLYQNITLANGKKQLKHAPAISSISLSRFVVDTVAIYKSSSVLTFGAVVNNGTGWNKTAYQAQRGHDFATAA